MIKKFLIWLGVISPCCNARMFAPVGWDRLYCRKCQKRVV